MRKVWTRTAAGDAGCSWIACSRWLGVATFLFVFSFSSQNAMAAKDWPVARGPSREPSPYQYDPRDWKKVPAAFLEDALACYLHVSNAYRIEADGTVEITTHEVLRLNGRKAVENLGEYRNIIFNPDYEKLTLNEARIHKVDGKIQQVEARNVQLRDSATDYHIYDSSKQLILSLPNLEVGDVIEVRWTVRGKNPEYDGYFFSRYPFGDESYPVYADSLHIRVPKMTPLKYAPFNPHRNGKGNAEPVIKKGEDYTLYSWRQEELLGVPKDDHLPSKEQFRPGIAFSTFPDWDAVAEWLKKLHKGCWECTPDLKRIVAAETRDARTPLDKAKALTYWLRRNIRYVSTGERHDYTPHAPSVVVANRFGDCKDGAQLLAVLFREAGIPASVAYLNVEGDGQIIPELPSPAASHAILHTVIDGKEYWVDTTARQAAWDLLPAVDCDRVAFVVQDHGVKHLRTPRLTADCNRTEYTTFLTLHDSAITHGNRLVRSEGLSAWAQREEWADEPSGEIRRKVASELNEFNTRARVSRVQIDPRSLQDLDHGFKAEIWFTLLDHVQAKNDEWMGLVSDDVIWSQLLSITIDPDRTTPLELGEPRDHTHRFIIEAPFGFKMGQAPSDEKHVSKWARFERSVQVENGSRWVVTFRFRLEQSRVEPQDFDLFVAFQERVQEDYRFYARMLVQDDPIALLSDIGRLEMLRLFFPSHPDVTLPLARLYCRLELRDMARRILRESRKDLEEQKEYLLLRAELAEGKELAAAYQELIQRFPNEARYPMQLAERLLASGDVVSASQQFRRVSKSGPEDIRAEAHLKLAEIRLREAKPAIALEEFRSAEKLHPTTVESPGMQTLLGQIYVALKKYPEARKVLEHACEIDPRAPQPYAQLVPLLEVHLKDRSSAIRYATRWLAVVEEYPETTVELLQWLLRLDRVEQANELLQTLAGKRSPATNQLAGVIAARRGDWEAAAKAFRELKKIEPDATGLLGPAMFDTALARGDYPALLQSLKAYPVDQIKPFDPERLTERRKQILEGSKAKDAMTVRAVECYLCAELASRLGRPESQVSRVCEQSKGIKPLAAALSLQAWYLIDRGRMQKATLLINEAIQLDPKEPGVYLARGRVRLERGETEAAIEDLRTADAFFKSTNLKVLKWYGLALLAGGKTQEAISVLEKAAKGLPDDGEVKEALGSLKKP